MDDTVVTCALCRETAKEDETHVCMGTCISIGMLAEMCRDYDKEHGCYPEHEWEGLTLFNAITERLFPGRVPQGEFDWPER